MKIKLISTLTILIIFSFQLNAQELSSDLLTIDTFLKKEYPQNRPGAVVLIAKESEVIYKAAFGLADVKRKKTIKTDMIFQIGSMTKQFTSAAILQLVEEGQISLDDPIQKYVEYYPKKSYPITIHHLLSQTSGIPEFFDVDEDEMYLLSQEHTPEQLIAYYKDQPLLFVPGTKFQYSNSNYPLLGVVIEKVSGLPLKEYLKINLFEPLEMNSTSLWYKQQTKKKRIPKGYRYQKGKLILSPQIVGSVTYSAGGIVSTVDDLLIWNQEFEKQKILTDFVVEHLTSEKRTSDNIGTGYGYGFFLKELQGSRTIQHGGNLYGFTSSGLSLDEDELFVCVLSNKSFERTEEVANYLASIILNKPLAILDKNQLEYNKYEEYFGTYQLKNGSKLIDIFMIDDVLVLDFPEARGTGAQLTPIEKDKMESSVANFKISFSRNENGQINGFIAEQNGITEWIKTK